MMRHAIKLKENPRSFSKCLSCCVYEKQYWKINKKGCIKLIKSDNKDNYNVTKDFYFK